MNYSNTELLAPCGNTGTLSAAINSGADAIYVGTKDFNARARAKNFAYKELEITAGTLHKMGRKIYVVVNTVIEEWEVDRVYNLLKYLTAIGIDGIIVQDLGILQMIRDNGLTDLPIHGSTQMNISNARGANLLGSLGVKRVVVSRELSFEEIKSITSNTNVEIEMFVHGALCVCASGMCQFSSFFGGKSANRGQCTQACRRIYTDNNGDSGYFFSTRDLCLLENVPQIVEAGVASLKIEGRMKSADYVGSVVSAYRYMLDNYQSDYENALQTSKNILAGDLARLKTKFFFENKQNKDFLNTSESGQLGVHVGNVVAIKTVNDTQKTIICSEVNNLEASDWIRIINQAEDKHETYKIIDKPNGKSITIETKKDMSFGVGDSIYLFKKNEKQQPHSNLIKFNLAKYHHPGITDIHTAHNARLRKNKYGNRGLEQGVYIQINKFAQFFLIQSFKPRKVIFSLTHNNCVELLSNISKVPYSRDSIIIDLPPFLAEGDTDWLAETIANLKKLKINTFIANNVSELSYFKKDKSVLLIAGPYLYTFNSYAVEWLLAQGVSYIIAPLEISKKNLYDLLDIFGSNLFLLNVFAFPVLFNIQANLQTHPDILHDNKDNEFFVIREKYSTRVIPSEPFSILDKQPLLLKNKLKKIIVNLCDVSLSKSDYKNLVKKLATNENVKTFSRFNWNDGFYRDDASYNKK